MLYLFNLSSWTQIVFGTEKNILNQNYETVTRQNCCVTASCSGGKIWRLSSLSQFDYVKPKKKKEFHLVILAKHISCLCTVDIVAKERVTVQSQIFLCNLFSNFYMNPRCHRTDQVWMGSSLGSSLIH